MGSKKVTVSINRTELKTSILINAVNDHTLLAPQLIEITILNNTFNYWVIPVQYTPQPK